MSHAMKLCIHLIQEFQPIAQFYTSILIEEKKFEVYEVSNRILPFYFYYSFGTLIFCSIVIEFLGHAGSLVALMLLQLLMLFIIAVMRARKFIFAQIVYAIGGAVGVYKCVLRTMLVTSTRPIAFQLTKLKLLRQIVIAFASWIGQGVYNITYDYKIIIALSIISTIVAGVLSLLDVQGAVGSSSTSVLDYVKHPSLLKGAIGDVYTKDLAIGALCGSASSIMQIYLSIFSQSLFHEMHETSATATGLENNVLYVMLDTPIRYIASVVVWGFTRISPKFGPSRKRTVGSRVKSGYIEGTVKICAGLASMAIVSFISAEKRQTALMLLFPLSIFFFAMLSAFKTFKSAKLIYFVALTAIMSSEAVGKSFIQQTKVRVLITTFCLFTESTLHSLINTICRLFSLKSSTKGAIYTGLAMAALAVSLYMQFY